MSNLGNVKSLQRTIYKLNGKPQPVREKVHKGIRTQTAKYLSFFLCKTGEKEKYVTVHRQVALSFIINPKNKPFVNHKDGNKLNNNIKNLEWCTHTENTKHAVLNNLVAHGSKQGSAKLTENDVINIRERFNHSLGETAIKLSNEYNVSASTIYYIIQNKSWKRAIVI